MIKKYKEIKSLNAASNSNDQLYSKLLSHPISLFVTAAVEGTRLTPNHLTVISLLFSLLGTYTLAFDFSEWGLVKAWLLLHFALVFDSADGQLARWKKTSSTFGAYLDVFTDQIQHRLVIIAIALRLDGEVTNIFLVALIALAIDSLASHENVLQKLLKLRNSKVQDKRNKVAEKTFGQSILVRLIQYFLNLRLEEFFMLSICLFLDELVIYLFAKIVVRTLWLLKRIFLLSKVKDSE